MRLEGLPRDVVQQVPCEVVALRSRRVRLDGDFEPDGARERRARDVVPHVGVVAPVGGGGGGVVQLSLLLLLMLLLLLLLLLMLLMLLLLLLLLMLLLLMMLLHLRTQLVEGPLRRMRGGGGGVPLKGLEREGVHPGQRARAPPRRCVSRHVCRRRVSRVSLRRVSLLPDPPQPALAARQPRGAPVNARRELADVVYLVVAVQVGFESSKL